MSQSFTRTDGGDRENGVGMRENGVVMRENGVGMVENGGGMRENGGGIRENGGMRKDPPDYGRNWPPISKVKKVKNFIFIIYVKLL